MLVQLPDSLPVAALAELANQHNLQVKYTRKTAQNGRNHDLNTAHPRPDRPVLGRQPLVLVSNDHTTRQQPDQRI